jgi:hypothetical protein
LYLLVGVLVADDPYKSLLALGAAIIRRVIIFIGAVAEVAFEKGHFVLLLLVLP